MMQSTQVKIKSIKKLPTTDRYDITVEDNHNFFANGVLIHNTSYRSANLKKIVPLTFFQKLVNMLFRRKVYQEKLGDYEYVTGTRRVVLNEKNVRAGFHGSDSFRVEVTNSYKHALKEGMTFYGEIFGWVNSTPIMGHYSTEKLGKDYFKKYGKNMVFSYGVPKDTYGTIVYRITQDVENEKPRDLMWDEIVELGQANNIPMNKPLLVIESYDGDSKKLREIVEALTEREGDKLTEDYVDPTHISEGVILHVEKDGQVYYIKNKAFAFKVLENIAKLEDKVDVEEQESSEISDEQP